MKKSILVVAACLICVFSFQAFTTSHQPGFHNLKILPKDISKHDLDSVMHFFAASLGVHCTYCHEGDPATRRMDFASDAKPEKLIARKMMLMNIDINKNDFQQIAEAMDSGRMAIPTDTAAISYMLRYVTCYTCHRGDPHPDNKPPKREEGMPPMPPMPSSGNK
ncbi:MAG TPA: c-type cytochrome [Hanamia sp.]|nr:c-type cytochrome [Hanamia sp.]